MGSVQVGVGPVTYSSVARPSISEDLAIARTHFATASYSEAARFLDSSFERILELIERGVEPADPILAMYYAARLMKKFSGVANNFNGSSAPRRNAVQVLVFDSTGTE